MSTRNCGQSSARVNTRPTRTLAAWIRTRPLCRSLKTSPPWSLQTWVSLPATATTPGLGFWIVIKTLETRDSLDWGLVSQAACCVDGGRWKAHSLQFSTCSFVGHSGTKELNSLSALVFVIQTCHLLCEKSGSGEPGRKGIALFQVQWHWAVMARMAEMGRGATHCRGGDDRFSSSGVSRSPKRLFNTFIQSDSEWLYSLLRRFGWEMIWEISVWEISCLRLWRNVCVEIPGNSTLVWCALSYRLWPF